MSRSLIGAARRAGGAPRNGRQQEETGPRWVQTVCFFMSAAGLTIEQTADRADVPRSRMTRLARGEEPIDAETARRLASALGCRAEEILSGPAGICVSGGQIMETHDMTGRPLPGVRPLTRTEWRASWQELDVTGVLPAIEISPESAGQQPDPESTP
jgi:transcriptional regulator with XRE-family HTH domain